MDCGLCGAAAAPRVVVRPRRHARVGRRDVGVSGDMRVRVGVAGRRGFA